MDTQVPAQDTTSTQTTQAPPTTVNTPTPEVFSWKSKLSADFAGTPTMQKFSDDQAGFNEAVKSHLSLERLLGHEKVPVPKGPDDKAAWDIFSKAMGIPDKPDAYKLTDVSVPPEMKGLSFDKKEFSEIAHALKLTPGQTNQLWDTYTKKSIEGYGQALKERQAQVTQMVNGLRGEWGDAYESKVELGQMVINKFAGDKDSQDFITASLLQHPAGVKFLSKIGEQFAENKTGDFGYKRFSLTPDQARAEADAIRNDPKDPYNNDKADPRVREQRIDYVNNLIKQYMKQG